LERAHDLNGKLADARPLFLSAQRTASLRHDDETQASLITCLLRSYVQYNLYDQADKLVSKTVFPASASNPQFARYHYYLGRIKAVQLNYSAAHTNLQQAIRRAPPTKTAPGFYQAVHKFSIVVELLMGDIPERSLFRHPVLEKALGAYFEIVKAVRTGSLSKFQTTLSAHAAQFESDKTYTLIARLRQNVIKTGIRRLSLSYSRISLRDICVKLHLDSEEDAEYIVGKAIRDGVIEGRVVHEKGWMECGSQKGGYGPEVSDVFARRIGYCLELHNESVKAMRYPVNAHRKELAAAEGAREREKELAKGIQEGDLDDEDLGGDF
jgi:26S proteasome regulatory subunit N3